MKKKIVISISAAVIVILIIVGFRFFNSAPVTLSKTQPMFGASSYRQYISNRTLDMKAADETFISDATANQTKEEAIKGALNLGWISITKNDLDTAMTRFNQAWLLDQDNFNVSWGYGAVLGVKGELQQSADYFDKAIDSYSEKKAVAENNYLSLWDDAAVSYLNLSDSYLKTDTRKAKEYAEKAGKLLTNSLNQIDKLPKGIVPQEKFLLAVAYFNNGDYKEARSAYDAAVKEFPQIKDDSSAVAFEKALGEKGV